jgi:hypothetical protein
VAVVEVARDVVCGECEQTFQLSARNDREHRRRGTVPRCYDCRHPLKPPDEAELARLREWWLERFTLDELRDLARCIWPGGAESRSKLTAIAEDGERARAA